MATKGSSPAGGGKTMMPKGDGVKAAMAGSSKGGGPAGGGREPTPRGDGLKQAWNDQTKRPSVLSPMDAAKKRVR